MKAKADTAGNVPAGAGLAPLPRTRRLIDLAGLVPRNEAGERLSANPRGGEPIQGHSSKSRAANLRDPDPTRPKAPTSAGRSVPDYTAEERESVGLELAKWALGLGDERVVDIRNQHNVGADAVDDLQNFYELKVFSSGIPDTVQLENSEVERALSTRDFFLVVVGNVEEGHGPAEVRFITDPVERLRVLPSGSVRLGGLLAADALRFTFDKDEAEAPGEPR